ncbi:MAG: UDP-N-acetylmuramoyl-L-alanine--D-glutamate ligase, partial [Pyrinomonadaceae bacterium]|nr:UDP-N-acetylmuramoyl-L-alanine--D-glutamate ligase [Pyrinomonadaceae bacterium]
LVSRSGGSEKVLTTRDDMLLRGVHNVENVLAALAAGLACGADPDSMRETIRTFNAVEHRLEHCGENRGITFYNDSKATSVDATKKALEALSEEPGKIVLILGGLGKNAPYEPLADLIEKSVRGLVLIGDDAKNIEAQLGSYADSRHAADMEDAVRFAQSIAKTGDTVLLAPACASFDMYKSFEERGNVFKAAVRSTMKEVSDASA